MAEFTRRPGAHALFALLVLAGCKDPVQTTPVPPLPETFLFVSGPRGNAQIHRWFADSVVPLTAGPGENVEPSAAAGRLAFTSYRDGNAEIYLANLDGSGAHRVIASSAFDNQPDLSLDASRLVFVSSRTGAQRVYLADSSGTGVTPLATGSAANVPETSPVWSPNGSVIAFASSRTGTSQIFVVPVAGGAALQLTHEAIGAFDPAWSAGGDTVFFAAARSSTLVGAVHVASGQVVILPTAGIGYLQPACATFGCLVVQGGDDRGGTLVALQLNGRRATPIETGSDFSRDPALVRGASNVP